MPLTCTQADEKWQFTLPAFREEPNEDVYIELMQSEEEHKLFDYNNITRTVSLYDKL